MSVSRAIQILTICAAAGAAYGQSPATTQGSPSRQMDGAAGSTPGAMTPRDPADCSPQEPDGVKQSGCADTPATSGLEQRGGSMPSPGNPREKPQTGNSHPSGSSMPPGSGSATGSGLSSGSKL